MVSGPTGCGSGSEEESEELSSDESGRASALQSDIYTYVAECIPKFILGEMDTETDWDTFVSNCEGMGLQEVIDIYQTAYDRYAA